MKALLLDLDGTIRRPTSGKFIEDPNDKDLSCFDYLLTVGY